MSFREDPLSETQLTREGCPTDVSLCDQTMYPSASHPSPNHMFPYSSKRAVMGKAMMNTTPHQRGNTLARNVAAS